MVMEMEGRIEEAKSKTKSFCLHSLPFQFGDLQMCGNRLMRRGGKRDGEGAGGDDCDGGVYRETRVIHQG